MEAGPLISNTCLQTHSFTTKLNQTGTPLQDNDYGATGVATRQGHLFEVEVRYTSQLPYYVLFPDAQPAQRFTLQSEYHTGDLSLGRQAILTKDLGRYLWVPYYAVQQLRRHGQSAVTEKSQKSHR